jgi:hypothetical protein
VEAYLQAGGRQGVTQAFVAAIGTTGYVVAPPSTGPGVLYWFDSNWTFKQELKAERRNVGTCANEEPRGECSGAPVAAMTHVIGLQMLSLAPAGLCSRSPRAVLRRHLALRLVHPSGSLFSCARYVRLGF